MPQEAYKVIIVGAGPAGLSAAARARQRGCNDYLVLEKSQHLAHTLETRYSRGKLVMAEPDHLPCGSDLVFREGSRETVLEAWQQAALGLNIQTNTEVQSVINKDGVFKVQTNGGVFTAENVVLAIGTWGNPNRLKVDLPETWSDHIRDTLDDPDNYAGKKVVVVGAGNSAAEVIVALAAQSTVIMSYYKQLSDSPMNGRLRQQINTKIDRQEITAYFGADVKQIEPGCVSLYFPTSPSKKEILVKDVDWVFTMIGAQPPQDFLKRCDATFSSPEATLPIMDERYQTKSPGLYLIGAITGRDLIKHALNQGSEVMDYILGYDVQPVDEPELQQNLQRLPGSTVHAKLAYLARAVPLLKQVNPLLRRELALESTIKYVEPGDIIFAQGDFSTDVYAVIEGSVEISYKTDPAGRIRLDPTRRIRRTREEFFGEMSLIADRRRTGTATAVETSLLLVLPRSTMFKLLKTEPSVKQLIDEAYALRTLQTYLCPDLSLDDLRQFTAHAVTKQYRKDADIFKSGDPEDGFYVVRSGSVKISKTNTAGREYVITYLPVGSYFGEMALLDPHRTERAATATAATAVEVIYIPQEDFLHFLAQHPALEKQMRQEAAKRAIETPLILAAPAQTEGLSDFIKHGVIESTDVLLIDETKCIRCDNCVDACKTTHGGYSRLERVTGPSFASVHVPIACRHCEGAPCLQDCKAGDAITRNAEGVVVIDEEKCIGCRQCADACPYNVIFMVETSDTVPAPPEKTLWQTFISLRDLLKAPTTSPASSPETAPKEKKEIAVKCDLCEGIKGGPACVRSCPTGAAIRITPEYFKTVKFN